MYACVGVRVVYVYVYEYECVCVSVLCCVRMRVVTMCYVAKCVVCACT